MSPKRRKSETPEQSFYQIALHFTSTSGPKIPEEYRQFMEKELAGGQQLVTLMVSNTERWQVQVNKDEDDHLVFQDGWEKFYADNSLNNDHLLVFTYHGQLQFCVDVFDHAGIRIK